MPQINKKFLKLAVGSVVVFILAGTTFYYRAPLEEFLRPYLNRFLTNLNYQLESAAPCRTPITFNIGAVDPRFGLSADQAITAIAEASEIWSEPVGKNLFAYAPASGQVTVNFVYDYRQETTDKLKSLGIVVETTQQSYEELRARYDSLNFGYQAEKAELDRMIGEFERQQDAYNREVEKWNRQGGAPKNVFDALNKTAAVLAGKLAAINAKTEQVNGLIEDLNAEGSMLNKLIAELNLNVDKYNIVGETTGREFQEGVYIQDENGRRIEVYQFGDRTELIRLLAHELGHALGLDHSAGVDDIMYYLNEAGNEKLTANDLAALTARCRIK